MTVATDQVEVTNPSTGRPLAVVDSVSPSELDERVELAGAAAEQWQRTPVAERSRVLAAIAGAIDDEAPGLARKESENVGKPISEARGEVWVAARTFRYYAGAIDKHFGQTIPSNAGSLHYTLHQPYGVVAAIVPWNFPLVLAAYKVAPALAAGNAVLLKPAGLTPLTALRLAELAVQAGLPHGCFQVLVGRGNSLGSAIVEHPAIPKISFTGSTAVGREIFQRSSEHLKRLTLELGGKSANLIFADASLDQALDGAIESAFANAGQDCCARSRILVERSVYPAVRAGLEERISAIEVGDPLEQTTAMGPLVSAAQRDQVLGYLAAAERDGATTVCGGAAVDGPGFFVKPTLLDDVTPAMSVMREEIFGPVVALHPFEDEEQAIGLANDTDFGLSASVWTQHAGRAARVARALQAGVVSINSSNSVHVTAPFGGFKASGLGRELGMAALDAYTEHKSVYQAIDL